MRQHIMKQPNLQELGCPNAKKSRVAFVTSFVTSKHVTNTTAILYNIQISSSIECKEISVPDSVHAIIISREVVFNEISQWQQVKRAQFVAVGPSMC